MLPATSSKKTGPARGDETRATEPDHGSLQPPESFNRCRFTDTRKEQAAMAFIRYRDVAIIGDIDEAADALARFTALAGGAL